MSGSTLAARMESARIDRRIRRHSSQLRPGTVREAAIRAAGILLFTCCRNELIRIPAFLDYYRKLGVQHFLFLDNQSTDGLQGYLADQPDCSVWLADGSYKESNFGMDWCNHLLATYGPGKWCVTVDPDELLVYPHCTRRGLPSLIRYMESQKQVSLFAPLLDAYGRGRLSDANLTPGLNPFELCPYIDRFNLCQRYNDALGNFWVQGGVRMRRFFLDTPERGPALNKVPLVKWRAGLRYESSMHHMNDPAYNCTVLRNPLAVSGVLFHFKYVNLLTLKAAEEIQRGEHYAGSFEYKAYLDAGDPVLYDPAVSIRYESPEQLQKLGFMQAGGWY